METNEEIIEKNEELVNEVEKERDSKINEVLKLYGYKK